MPLSQSMETTSKRNVKVNNWIFLSKNKEDPFINQFARGCGAQPVDTEEFKYADSTAPLCFRGILKKKIIRQCWEDQRTFYFMDTGYFGNDAKQSNPHGYKVYHRIVKNNLQHQTVVKRPSDRWEALKQKIVPWKKDGRKILLAAPDEKPCKFYDVDNVNWVDNTISELKKYTDRPIEVRQRNKLRIERTVNNTLKQALDDDVFALVTFNSNAATESVLYGIPVFVLAPVNAAAPVGLTDLRQIEKPFYPSSDEIYEWACHLAYGQFHVNELKTGMAKRMLLELW